MEEDKIKKLQKTIDEMLHTRDKLISITSHDLKTPLTCIIGFAKILKQKTDMDKGTKEICVDAIIQESERMYTMVNNILIWQQIKADKLKMTMETIDICHIIKNILPTLQEKIEKAKLLLLTDFEEPMAIKGDREYLKEIIENLLDNAVKYTPDGGKIIIKCSNLSGKVNLFISDSGKGIDEEVREHIFQPVNPIRGARGEKGNGLGLFITKELLNLHKGTINFETSEKGTIFSIEFPGVI